MTEKTAKIKIQDVYVIDPVAFFGALVAAPLAVAVGGVWAAGIPVFALVLGGPFYLVIGVPVLLWHLAHRPPEPGRIAVLAFVSFAIPAALCMAYLLLVFGQRAAEDLAIFVFFGLIFAPLWGGVFGIFYRKFQREIYAHPI